MTSATAIDTDILIHLQIGDDAVISAAQSTIATLVNPSHVGFSKVELKGSYIKDLILLRNKIQRSTDIKDAFMRALHSGGRKAVRMVAQLATHIRDTSVTIALSDWDRQRSALLTHLDGEIANAWTTSVTLCQSTLDALRCSRAAEPPVFRSGGWQATVPRCTPANTDCLVVRVFQNHRAELSQLVSDVAALQAAGTSASDELMHFADVAAEFLKTGTVPWEGTFCRSIGDLLIGLEAVSAGAALFSSNHNEHRQLAASLQYQFIPFAHTVIRRK